MLRNTLRYIYLPETLYNNLLPKTLLPICVAFWAFTYITKKHRNNKIQKDGFSPPFFYQLNLITLKHATCRCNSILHFFFALDFLLGLASSFALSSSSFFLASASARALAIFLGLVGSLSNKYWAKVATGSGGLNVKQKTLSSISCTIHIFTTPFACAPNHSPNYLPTCSS